MGDIKSKSAFVETLLLRRCFLFLTELILKQLYSKKKWERSFSLNKTLFSVIQCSFYGTQNHLCFHLSTPPTDFLQLKLNQRIHTSGRSVIITGSAAQMPAAVLYIFSHHHEPIETSKRLQVLNALRHLAEEKIQTNVLHMCNFSCFFYKATLHVCNMWTVNTV